MSELQLAGASGFESQGWTGGIASEGGFPPFAALSGSAARALHVVSASDEQLKSLAEQLESIGAEVLRLDGHQGLSDLTRWLDSQGASNPYEEISFYSHGSSGQFTIGGQRISRDSLTGLAHEFAALGNHLSSEGDLLIYGCSVGAGFPGEQLLRDLAVLTGADVAASDDRTGSLDGADWDLEVSTGQVGGPARAPGSLLTWEGSLDLPGVAPIPAGITPNAFVTSAQYYDINGDVVDVRLSGAGSFSLALAGGKTNNADALELVLSGVDASSDLSITVIPVELPINAGVASVGVDGLYNRMYSPGYTSLTRISAAGAGQFGDLLLSAAIVGSIDFKDRAINSIVLDTGYATIVDRVNSSSPAADVNVSAPNINVTVTQPSELEVFDESPVGNSAQDYSPVTGLIDLGDINARSIGSLVINGSISAPTSDPNDDEVLTNDLRGTITCSESIGEIQAQRSALTGAIRAASIGAINVGRIQGEITTTDASKALTLNLTSEFRGFINAAGHANIGYSFDYPELGGGVPQAEKIFGQVIAGGGISGSDLALDDALYLPNLIFTLFKNSGTGVSAGGAATTNRIADVYINGLGTSRWISAGDIGNMTANSFGEAMLVEAGGNIGDIEAYLFNEIPNPQPQFPPEPAVAVELSGTFQAAGSMGNVKSATSVSANLRAGQNIGNITAFSGGINSGLIEAGGSIGNVWAQNQIEKAAKIVAKTGNLGNLYVGIGNWDGGITAGGNVGNITLAKGALNLVKIAAGGSIGDIKVAGSLGAIVGGSIVAGNNIGAIDVSTTAGSAILGALIQAGGDAGDRLTSIKAVSYGVTQLPAIEPGLNNIAPDVVSGAIVDTQILAAEIGTISGRAYTGVGIADSVIHAQRGSLDGISAKGNSGGLLRVTAVAEQNLGPVEGYAEVQGSGIEATRINSNTGSIGVVKAQGGVAGGYGISASYLQAASEISGIQGTSNANQGDAIYQLTATANTYGTIIAKVLGGEGAAPLAPPPPFPQRIPTGSGIVDSYFKGNLFDGTDTRPGIEAIIVDVKSLYGYGINNSEFSVKDNISSISVSAYNNTAIIGSRFSASRGVIGGINAEATQKGRAILNSTFATNNGDIGLLGGISARAYGTGITDNAIEGATFDAANGIGAIDARSKGGTAILGSTFLADTDLSGSGRITSIKAVTEGQNLASSMGIAGSTFNGAEIGSTNVSVDDFEGGAAISGSSFTARTATYDGNGNFDNRGKIGDITISSLSRVGNGIETSTFLAGAAGSIGNITIDLLTRKLAGEVDGAANGSSGKGIYLSRFQASSFDYDQNLWNGKIGNITIKAGRVEPTLLPAVGTPPNDQITAAAAGIDLSYFGAYGGIGNITIDTIGTGVFGSAFLADFDVAGLNNLIAGTILSSLAAQVPGNLGDVTIKTNGRFASGSVLSLFTGASVGNINIEANVINVQSSPTPALPSQPSGNPVLALIRSALQIVPGVSAAFDQLLKANDRFGLAGVVGSAFVATEKDIGSIRVVNTGATGRAALGSAFLAKGSLGPVGFTPELKKSFGDIVASGLARLALSPLGYKDAYVYTDSLVLIAGAVRPGTVPGGIDPGTLPVATLLIPGSSDQTAFAIGKPIDFQLSFREPVIVTGAPSLGITFPDGSRRQADLIDGSGTNNLVFRYVVKAGDLVRPLLQESLTLDTQLTTTAGNVRFVSSNTPIPAVTLVPIGNVGSLALDGVSPIILGSSDNSDTIRRRQGAKLEIQITFDEPVNVVNSPFVRYAIGGRIVNLVYSSGAGTNILTFEYILKPNDLRGQISIDTPRVITPGPGGVITDLAGNLAVLRIPPLQSQSVQTAAVVPSSQPLEGGSSGVLAKPQGTSGAAAVLAPKTSRRKGSVGRSKLVLGGKSRGK